MRKPPLILALIGLAFAAGGATAESPDSPKSKRMICRAAQKTIGSHMRTPRRCRTAEQWQAEDEAAGRAEQTLRTVPARNEGRQRPQ